VPRSIRFLDLEDRLAAYDSARAVVLPVPYERTVSYGSGTAAGPQAILQASTQVELYDEVLATEPCAMGIATLPAMSDLPAEPQVALAAIEREVATHLAEGKFVVTLGGEHSLTLGPVRAARAAFGEIGVVQFDAHADLRDTYQGTPYSHACIMRRILELGLPTLAIGIRALSLEEGVLIAERGLATVWAQELANLTVERFRALLTTLPERIYLTFDVDFFDPALVPATGTPVPGGGDWYPTLDLLRELFATKRVVAMDVVELAPQPVHPASDFLTAQLVYKSLGFLRAAEVVR
jgi:agmatinase